jgi:hypothetical protein
MTLANDKHQEKLRAAGWHSRGYLPHFDGIARPQFIIIHLADSLPKKVLQEETIVRISLFRGKKATSVNTGSAPAVVVLCALRA